MTLSIVRRILRLPVIGKLYVQGMLFPALLAVAVIGILVHGAINRGAPEDVGVESLPLQIPVTVPSLRPDLEKTPLTYISDYWRQLGGQVRNRFVLLGSGSHPGVVVAPGVALTTIDAADDVTLQQRAVEEQGGRVPQEVLGLDTWLNLALIAVKQDDPNASFSLGNSPDVAPGSFLAEVGIDSGGSLRISPATIVSWDSAGDARLEITPAPAALGFVGALVDLDGALAGVSVPDDNGVRLLAHDQVMELVDRLASGSACLAIEVADLGEEIRRLLGVTGGVAIERIRADAFVPEPSLRGGDILLEWDGNAVSTTEEFASLYLNSEPGNLIPYTVLRGRQRVSGRTRMPQRDCRPVSQTRRRLPGLGMTVDQNQSGEWQVIAVTQNGVAESSGIEKSDLILAVNGTELRNQGQELLVRLDEGADTPVVTVQRSDRTLLLVLGYE